MQGFNPIIFLYLHFQILIKEKQKFRKIVVILPWCEHTWTFPLLLKRLLQNRPGHKELDPRYVIKGVPKIFSSQTLLSIPNPSSELINSVEELANVCCKGQILTIFGFLGCTVCMEMTLLYPYTWKAATDSM